MLTDSQLKERVHYIGASEAAAVLGMSRWGSPLSVWAEKTGAIKPEDISDLLPVKLGNKLEQTVAELFMEETGKQVARVNSTVYHPKYPFIGANLDRRVVGERAVLECKTAGAFKYKEWEGDEFPAEYVIQVMHQLAVTGYERGYLAVLIGNQDFKIKTIDRDEEALAKLVNREVEFWKTFIEPNVMPSVIRANDKDTLSRLFPEAADGKEIELDDRADAICEILDGMKADKRNLEAKIEQHENELRAMLKDAEIGRTNNHKIYWANVTTNRLDTDALKEKRPEVFAAFRKMTTARRLLIKTNKQEATQ